jgi:hypothetical protein
MFHRVMIVAGVLFLAGCQQSFPGRDSSAGVTSPSSLALKPIEVPFSGVAPGEASFDFMTNPKACASGFTTVTTAIGPASHMGVTTWRSQHCASESHQLLNAEVVLTAANGDELRGTYTGSCGAVGGVGDSFTCSGNAMFSGGTGRFVDASGTATWSATVLNEGFTDFSWPGRWQWDGTIRY